MMSPETAGEPAGERVALPIPSWRMIRDIGHAALATAIVPSIECPSTRRTSSTSGRQPREHVGDVRCFVERGNDHADRGRGAAGPPRARIIDHRLARDAPSRDRPSAALCTREGDERRHPTPPAVGQGRTSLMSFGSHTAYLARSNPMVAGKLRRRMIFMSQIATRMPRGAGHRMFNLRPSRSPLRRGLVDIRARLGRTGAAPRPPPESGAPAAGDANEARGAASDSRAARRLRCRVVTPVRRCRSPRSPEARGTRPFSAASTSRR